MKLQIMTAALAAALAAPGLSGGAQAQAPGWTYEETQGESCAYQWNSRLGGRNQLTLMVSRRGAQRDNTLVVLGAGVAELASGADVVLGLPNGDERPARMVKNEAAGQDMAFIRVSNREMGLIRAGFDTPGDFSLIDPSGAEPRAVWRFTHLPALPASTRGAYMSCVAGIVVAAGRAAAQP
ncbi:hypothetical protein F1654_04610 [Alkalicaulis satelles]|uniref:Uncharacterized protein n=1 Tax=Alkalicaulis satelles TaxID=2609175 RepID=A0A5M6ZKB2_9PROT|nr:hypothetical protein [Alkalicaulis satelles]KAA5805266.1 hypothetical protein F1654_04610 [Alkalicaulis satelles]